ncbi:uncharacterized protein LOC132757447 [Ruditapes philippinarum]|uniref:uncharacterized protein LOC132757447 n=1 Tax=Ruditapes philippinarum TaxID=129788 RepID=UPI00295A787F|nr:uncharacterized protein LOC132757447 [Ruditapes philippinarum]
MLVVLLVCALSAVNAINTNEQRHYLDMSFARYDHSPKDGSVMEVEWDATIYREDVNNDTCVTLAEYLSVHSCPVASTLYAHYDHDSDGCLNTADMSQEFHMIDHSHDNVVSLHEWEQYFLHLTKKLFPHLGHQGR